jgi:hypothetical protein
MRNAFTSRSHSGRFTGAMFCAEGDPASGDIHGGVNVGVTLATGCTREYVAAPDTQYSAFGADLRGVGRLDVFDLDSAPLSFVGHKDLQLTERPAGHHPAGVLVKDLASLPNACKPFHADCSALCAFGFGNDGLTQIMVLPGDAAAFSSRLSPQRSPGTAVVSRLQRSPDFVAGFLEPLAVRARLQRAVGSGGGVADSQVHAHRGTTGLFRIRDHARGQQIPLTAHKGEIAFPFLRSQQNALAIAARKRYVEPPIQRPDRDARFRIREDAAIVGSGSARLKAPLDSLIEFVGVGNLRDRTHGGLGCQSESLPRLSVAKFVEIELAKGLRFPGNLADVIARGVKGDQRAGKRISLSGGRKEFELRRQVHSGFLLRFDVLLNSRRRNSTRAANVVTPAPERRHRLESGKLLAQFVRRVALHLIRDVLQRVSRRSLQKQVNVIGHYFQGHDLAIKLFSLRSNQGREVCTDRAHQNFAPEFRTPDEVIGHRRNTAAKMSVTFDAHNTNYSKRVDSWRPTNVPLRTARGASSAWLTMRLEGRGGSR